MSQVTSHVLDTSKGRPAAGVAVSLYQQAGSNWQELSTKITNSDGRITDLVAKDFLLPNGVYKLKFLTADYFKLFSIQSFYPFIEIIFEITSGEHYHVPLLLNPFGYSTYRGS